jgi:hypothetical protein
MPKIKEYSKKVEVLNSEHVQVIKKEAASLWIIPVYIFRLFLFTIFLLLLSVIFNLVRYFLGYQDFYIFTPRFLDILLSDSSFFLPFGFIAMIIFLITLGILIILNQKFISKNYNSKVLINFDDKTLIYNTEIIKILEIKEHKIIPNNGSNYLMILTNDNEIHRISNPNLSEIEKDLDSILNKKTQ